MREITVNLPPPSEPYSILIEPGLLSRIGKHVRKVAPHARCMLVMDANVIEPHGTIAMQSLRDAGYDVVTATLTANEQQKTLASVESLYRAMLAARLERRSPLIALGGGIVGDIAGFAAATYLRGVPLIHVPTTLLAMVDASIGGKTGVNFPLPDSKDLGKNLIGAFWQPQAVLVDPDTLQTLSPRDLRCGLAECIKHALIADEPLLRWIEDSSSALQCRKESTVTELIHRCASIKATIVAHDECEHSQRALLNLGHTFGHAIESIAELDLRHGEAVAIGLVAATWLATELGMTSADDAHRIAHVVDACELPDRLPASINVQRLMQAMTFDKKAADGMMRLVLPRGIGAAEIVEHVPEQLVRDAWLSVGAAA